ncbi:MAG: hypothetical protein PHP42_07650, partial [Bacteroidota bacterium]|nr:hypothetical protein [Bacteroidota bacterium]
MNIRFVLSFFLLLCTFLVHAQTKLTDSLSSQLGKSTVDTTKVLLLVELAKEFVPIDLKKSEEYAQSAQQLAEKINYIKGLSAALNIHGLVIAYLGDYTKGVAMLKRALEIRKSLNDLHGASGTL